MDKAIRFPISKPDVQDRETLESRVIEVQDADLHTVKVLGEVNCADLKPIHRATHNIYGTNLYPAHREIRRVSNEIRGNPPKVTCRHREKPCIKPIRIDIGTPTEIKPQSIYATLFVWNRPRQHGDADSNFSRKN